MSEKKSKKPKKVRKNYSISLQVAVTERKLSKLVTKQKLVNTLKRLGITVYDVRITEIHDRVGTGEDTSN